jgi:hypothetical protein
VLTVGTHLAPPGTLSEKTESGPPEKCSQSIHDTFDVAVGVGDLAEAVGVGVGLGGRDDGVGPEVVDGCEGVPVGPSGVGELVTGLPAVDRGDGDTWACPRDQGQLGPHPHTSEPQITSVTTRNSQVWSACRRANACRAMPHLLGSLANR